jgi:molybdenum cofactor biosynthesis enzyme MoaA
MNTSIVWFTTWACNFKCAYCWQVQGQKIGQYKPTKFIDADKWIHALNRLNPVSMAISGGEPFMQPGLIDIINGLVATNIGLTSNLSYSLLDFVRKVSPNKVTSITASYHPIENKITKELFLGKVMLLREFGFNVIVNFVAWPEQLWLIPPLHAEFASHGIPMHIDPYAPMTIDALPYTRTQEAMLSRYVTKDRADQFPRDVVCSGGMNHFSIHPDGSAWRCVLEQQQGINSVGNIFEESFAKLSDPMECHQADNCPGCDRDHVQVHALRII